MAVAVSEQHNAHVMGVGHECARPATSPERPWRRAAVSASAVALVCLAVASSVRPRPAQLLESFDSGPDPDAPGGTRYFTSDFDAVRGQRPGGKIPSSAEQGPRQQDNFYRHVYTYTNYPHPGATNSENSVTVERLHRVTGEIRSAEQQFAQIDRQRAGVKGRIAALTKEETGLSMEAKSMHEDLMRYSSEEQAILGEMTDARKKEGEESAEGGAKEEVEEVAEEEMEEAEDAEPAAGAEAAPEGVQEEGGNKENGGETADGTEGEDAAERAEPGELTQEERIRALEDKVNLLEGELPGPDAAEKGKRAVLNGGKASQIKLLAGNKAESKVGTVVVKVLKKALAVKDASEKVAATYTFKAHSKLQKAPAHTDILNSFF